LNSGNKKSCGCLISSAEYELEKYLKQQNIKYKTQYKIKGCEDIKSLPFDFAIFDD
jgi:hypothetical protein